MSENVVEELARRSRRLRVALCTGCLCVVVALLGSYLVGGQQPRDSLSALSAINLLALAIAPMAFAAAAANFTSSDRVGKRAAYAVAAALLSLALLTFLAFQAWIGGGGHLRM